MSDTARAEKVKRARRQGFAGGVATAFRLGGRGRPAPATVVRGTGSLREDAKAIQRDGQRLFGRV